MTASVLTFTLIALLPMEPRPASPFAPSLPQLTEEEEAQFDKIIDNFIRADIGQLKGAEAKKAVQEFQKLGPEVIFALIRGMNRAALIESSCPAVVIGKKINTILRASNDSDLLDFARENIGGGIKQSKHLGIIKDLRAVCIIRKREIYVKNALAARNPELKTSTASLGKLSIDELTKAMETNRGSQGQLRPILIELEKRNGEQALSALAEAASSIDTETRDFAADLLVKRLSQLGTTYLKKRFKDERPAIRSAAARASVKKGLALGEELIDLLRDEEAEVRQASHDALVKLSKGVDHGPEAGATEAERDAAITEWRAWWKAREKK